jgi:hypothetical protein
MVKKNIELELQALILLQAQLGLVKTIGSDNKLEQDDEIMSIVIRKSKDEYDALLNSRQRTASSNMPIQKQQDLEIAKKIVKSEQITENLKSEYENQDYLNRKLVKDAVLNGTVTQEETNIRKPKQTNINEELEAAGYSLDKLRLNDKNNKRSVSNMKIRQENEYDDDDDDVQASVALPSNNNHNNQQIVSNLAMNYLQGSGVNSEAELARRAECKFKELNKLCFIIFNFKNFNFQVMQKQREILNEKKLVERKKQLEKFMRQTEENNGPKRPMSSRAARSVLSGADPTQIPQANLSSNKTNTDDEKKKIEARKMLAETLRKEVINNNKK